FLLRFARTQRARVALPVVALVGYGATLIALRGFFAAPDVLMWALAGVAMAVPYGADALAAGRLHGLARTLLFPAVDTAMSFLFSLDQSSPLGSWGATGYSQAANLPLLQVTSLVGVFGLSFLIMWAAPVVNELWERRFDLRAARSVVLPFAAVLLAALLFGGVRLALFPPSAPTVPMAALTPDRELNAARDAADLASGPRTAAERERLTEQHLAPVLDDLFARTRRAARAGARVVAWSEAAGYVFKEDERAFLDEAATVARDEGIYLELGTVFILPETGFPTNENRSILIDPDGNIRWDYHKATMVPGDGNALGTGELPVVDTPFGRLSVVICFDADFPWLVRQAGRAGVDVLLVPSSDWGPVGPVHADMAVVRAVENGVSILRPTRNGTSVAVDPHGRTLARADDFTAGDQTMMAALPIEGEPALYPLTGDAVGWALVIGVVLGTGALGWRALARRRRSTLS
ncbi:MAG TPA: nitrilase-related carbon-nitrogen hydrolase, partial [Euzebyales bacterium]|nr:nitrilase-related carbon-nitrogen hydrolase [Euzebyales bacterium]